MLDTMLLLNWWVATGVLFLELATVGKLFSLLVLLLPNSQFQKNFRQTIYGTKQRIFNSFGLDVLSEKFLMFFIFVFSVFASILTLVYSEIFLQVPCALCWFERIFMYGVVVLSGLALLKNPPQNQSKNILVFSFLGACVSLYHHVLQMTAGVGSHLPCPTSGGDCAKRLIFEYDHITFPWMAFVMFSFFIIIVLLQKRLK